MPIVIELVNEFRERMGCESVVVNGEFLFANGGRWVTTEYGTAHGVEPPTDPHELLVLRRLFVRAKVEKGEKQFVSLRDSIQDQAKVHAMGAGPEPHPDAIPVLKQTAAEVKKLRAELQAIEEQIAAHNRVERPDSRQEARVQAHARAIEIVKELRQIEI